MQHLVFSSIQFYSCRARYVPSRRCTFLSLPSAKRVAKASLLFSNSKYLKVDTGDQHFEREKQRLSICTWSLKYHVHNSDIISNSVIMIIESIHGSIMFTNYLHDHESCMAQMYYTLYKHCSKLPLSGHLQQHKLNQSSLKVQHKLEHICSPFPPLDHPHCLVCGSAFQHQIRILTLLLPLFHSHNSFWTQQREVVSL